MSGSQYQVRRSTDLVSPFEATTFATTASGIANQTIFNGTGTAATVYVDAEGGGGFFTLELMIDQLA